jgi:biofilm PGA synthesis N-glycosyltransferase PgaC
MHPGAWLFVAGSVFVVYALAGYPVYLALAARRRGRPLRTSDILPRVTVLLPVFNGGRWIAKKLDSLLNLDYPPSLLNIIVLSDGSTDDTNQIASKYSSEQVQLIKLPRGGKALALNHGLTIAAGDVLFFTDVRQEVARDCLRRLVAPFADPEVGAVCGELVILDGETQEEAAVGLYWKLEKWIRRQLSATGSLLVVTGCLYAVRRQLAEPLPADVLGDDIFMPQAVLKKGYRVLFEPSAKTYDFPTDLKIEFARKVRTLAGLYQYVLHHGLGPSPIHFFSYKISRLLLPYALILTAAGSFFLPEPLNYAALALQIAFYGLALADGVIAERTLFKRLSSPARTFCTLMLAALRAVSVLFVPASSLWKTTEVRRPRGSVSGD